MKKSRKPPLGPAPRFIYEENRIRELQDAIYRFIKANYDNVARKPTTSVVG